MKLICDTKRLAEAFALVATVAPTRSPKEILRNVRLDATREGISLSATDMELAIRVTVPNVDVSKTGSVLLPVAKTAAILRETSEETIAIENRNGKTNLIGSRSKFTLLSESPDEFPVVNGDIGEKYHEIDAARLALLFHRTSFATDQDSSRYALQGVNLESDGNKLIAVATDGRRAVWAESAAVMVGEHCIKTGTAIIPLPATRVIERACLGSRKGTAQIAVSLNDIVVQLPDCVLISRLVEGRYPNWRQIIPREEPQAIVTVPNGQLLNAVRQAAIATSSESRGMDFRLGESLLTLEARSAEVGESSVEIPVMSDLLGDGPLVLRLDPRFVQDFCRVMGLEETLTISVLRENAPVRITSTDGYETVIMPMAASEH